MSDLQRIESDENPIERPGYDALWGWFGLSRAGWLTIPRVLMHEMHDDWQARMAALLYEYYETFPNQPDFGTRVQLTTTLSGKLTRGPDWLNNYRYPDYAAIEELRGTATAPMRAEKEDGRG